MSEDNSSTSNPVDLATELTIAWLSNPNTRVSAEEVPGFLAKMHEAVTALNAPVAPKEEPASPEFTGAVTARKSLGNPDHIISMIDGKPYKSLKRHLSSHSLSPAEYRERYGLKSDYPMVAPSYSAQRREVAKRLGLGRKKGEAAPLKADASNVPVKRGRKPGSANA